MSSSGNKPPTHEAESRADRKQQRELAAARQSGAVAPAVDAATGQMINPHNPSFITQRPWYLGGDGAGGAGGAAAGGAEESLQHQADQRPEHDRKELSLTSAEELLAQQRQKLKQLKKKGQFVKGQWVEALKKNKMPYRICQITKIHKKGTEFDLKYEDGTVEERVKLGHPRAAKPRIRMTAAGSRAALAEDANGDLGKETYDSKRDPYHGYDRDQHNAALQSKYERKLAARRQLREQKQQEKKDKNDSNNNQDNDDNDNAAASDSDFDDSDIEDSNNDDSDNDEFLQQDERVIATRLARQGGVGYVQQYNRATENLTLIILAEEANKFITHTTYIL